MKKYTLLLIILISFSSCKEEVNKEPKTQVVEEEISQQNKEPIFLKYWSGMSEVDFAKINKELVVEGKIEIEDYGRNIKYLFGNGYASIRPFKIIEDEPLYNSLILELDGSIPYIKKDRIDGIILRGFDIDFLEKYMEKYNLENIVEYFERESYSLEENPLHENKDANEHFGNHIRNLNQEEVEKLATESMTINHSDKDREYTILKLFLKPSFKFKKTICVEKDNKVILFTNYKDISWNDPKDFYYQYGNKDSAYRIVGITDFTDPVIIYIDKDIYYNKIKSEEEIENSRQIEKELKKQKESIRQEKMYDEI